MPKALLSEGHYERLQLYTDRHSNKEDIYTGEPLSGQDLHDCNRDLEKAKLGKHLTDYQRTKHKGINQ